MRLAQSAAEVPSADEEMATRRPGDARGELAAGYGPPVLIRLPTVDADDYDAPEMAITPDSGTDQADPPGVILEGPGSAESHAELLPLPPPLESLAVPGEAFGHNGLYETGLGGSDTLLTMEFPCCEHCGVACGQGASCCDGCESTSRLGRFSRGVVRGLCCPDPCYEPHWFPLADAAFFTSAVRPQNQQGFRWDWGEDLRRPDRAEYFWARADGSGLGPTPPAGTGFGDVDYDELRHRVEVAHDSFGAWFEYSYRAVDAESLYEAGFGDMSVGTKTILFDMPLVQLAFQFRTDIPQGQAGRGLGTGHVALEPGLILGLNLSPRSFLQAEISEWIPLGGDAQYAGALLRYSASYNRELLRFRPGVALISTSEVMGWSFQDGAFTDPITGDPRGASGSSYLYVGSGLRLFLCDRIDIGSSAAFATTRESWAEYIVRTELRIRY